MTIVKYPTTSNIMKILKVDQKVKIGPYKYYVSSGGDHMRCPGYLNDIIFDHLKVNKKEFIETIVGYTVNGDLQFPSVRTLEDLTKVVNELQRLCGNFTITRKQFKSAIKKAKVCADWKTRLIEELAEQLILDGEASVSRELIKDMYTDANDAQEAILDELFPDYEVREEKEDDIISAQDLKRGEVMEVENSIISDYNGAWLMCIYSGFVDIKGRDHHWPPECTLKGKRIKVKIDRDDRDEPVSVA